MDNFVLYLKIGFCHVLDFEGYDHILFLAVLVVIYTLESWKKIIFLVTLFTIGHTLTLALAVFGYLKFDVEWIEFLIPVTIIITAVSNIIAAISNKRKMINSITPKQNLNLFYALCFGLIHGVGFSNGFKSLVGRTEDKFFPLIEFAFGVELAQVVIVISIVLLGIFLTKIIQRRLWIIIISSMVLALSLYMAYERFLF